MVTKIRLELVLLFLCLPLLAGRELAAQTRHENRQNELSEKFGYILAPVMSKDGVWLTVYKRAHFAVWEACELGKDTVMIFNLSDIGKARTPIKRPNILNMSFLGNSHLLLSSSLQTELLNLGDQTSIYFKGVKQFKTLNAGRLFLLHYNEEGKNRLELRDYNGEIIKTVTGVTRFYTSKKGSIYVITVNGKKGHDIYSLKGEKPYSIYRSTNKIVSLEPDPDDRGVMIFEQTPKISTLEVRYLDLKTNQCFSLKDALPLPLENCFSDVIREGEIYFLSPWIKGEREDSSLVDIWYKNDNKLEEKFYTPTREVYYVWEPGKNRIQRIGNDTLINNVFTGNERSFLSFDPYLLQDYIKPASYKINVYDRLKNGYSLMDTISENLYVSPDGQSVLYAKNQSWCLHYIATGEVKSFGDDRLQTPFFTSDGKRILFGGEGGLWIYGREENRLLRLDVFEGANIKILNATEKFLQGGIGFYQNTFDPDKPLLLELYDPSKNRKTYLLWKNWECDTIIPSTNRNIMNLIHDADYKHFSYIEEDYNLPPRLVYKQMERKEEVIYQSNKSDNDIHSVKQEIVSYTDSDGNPLKGILYYPMHYAPFQKYPMVVHIYAKQYKYANRYLFPTYYEDLGFNIRLFLENGYFVYLPDILIQGWKGPGKDALDCITRALDALTLNQLIDKDRIGLIGHSFGGYETDFISTQSNRFAAFVSGSGHSDIIWAYHAFSYTFLSPDHGRLESGIYDMQKPFADDKWLYFDNNPIYYADKVNSPILLWHGKEDGNVTSDHSMAFYNALRRNGKNVIALYYKDEGHVIQNKGSQFDLTCRILDWFDYFLKGDTEIDWIRKGMNE